MNRLGEEFVPIPAWLDTFHINKYTKKYDGRFYNHGGGNSMGRTRLVAWERIRKKKVDTQIKSYDIDV